jgi:DNA helicase II / ATP-dependent DNA helicase PcrA
MPTPTDEQQDIITETSRVSDSIMINAYAGCAKSTTLEMLAPRITSPALSLAFNRKIVDELKGRLPANFQTKSLNGLGHGAWMRALRDVPVRMDDRKLGKLVTDVGREHKIELPPDLWMTLRGAVSRAMQVGLVPDGIEAENPLVADSDEVWQQIADYAGIDEADFPKMLELAPEILRRNIAMAKSGIISFDDQIYCPTVLGGIWPKFPVILVDESQDLSPLNHEMIRLALRPWGRVVAVGDVKQAIYAWRGADANSMENLRSLSPAWVDKPLTMTFRCPHQIVARQQEHAPGYRAFHSNRDGHFVRFRGEWQWNDFVTLGDGAGGGRAILCRNNAPLLKLAFRLLRNGIGCYVAGRDIGKSLEALSRKICPSDMMGRPDCIRAILDWQESEIAAAEARGADAKADSAADRAECLLAVFDGSGAEDAGTLRRLLAELFARDAGLVVLSSIHRAKGLEWDVVMLLDPWRIPAKYARGAEALAQEYNLRYVAETRTRHTLVYASLDGLTFPDEVS